MYRDEVEKVIEGAVDAYRRGEAEASSACQGRRFVDTCGLAKYGGVPRGEFPYRYGWKSPLRMPKWAARTWLEVTGVRAERLRLRFASEEQFRIADSAPVEAHIEELKPVATTVISNEGPLESLHQLLDEWIAAAGIGKQT